MQVGQIDDALSRWRRAALSAPFGGRYSAPVDGHGDEPRALGAVAALADTVRRALFEHVRRSSSAVTREDAAAAVGISRKLAAFHLDKLVAAGLLEARAGNADRRVGRPPKTYAPADVDIRLSIPPRRHDLLAEVLVDAVGRVRHGEDAATAALRTAGERGRDAGTAARPRGARLGLERALVALRPLLERLGYQPDGPGAGPLRLRNCPFAPLAGRAPELVCGLNRSYLAGVLEGLGAGPLEAVLAPAAGQCCVELRARTV
jgi:predicted ArsR family transcriptional regulator